MRGGGGTRPGLGRKKAIAPGGPAGPNSMEGIPSEFKLDFWILPRLLKIAQRDLGGIWTWEFFLNSSRFLKDFEKKYNMTCHVMHPRQD
jgi:hypothetical protein